MSRRKPQPQRVQVTMTLDIPPGPEAYAKVKAQIQNLALIDLPTGAECVYLAIEHLGDKPAR